MKKHYFYMLITNRTLMDCPVCKKPAIILELDQIEIDHCPSCSGIWLDEGELELLLGESEEKHKLLSTFRVDPGNKEKPRRCPKCSKKMLKVYVGEGSEVLVDICKKEHGIWFDKGELNDIISMGTLDKDNKILKLLNDMFSYKLNH